MLEGPAIPQIGIFWFIQQPGHSPRLLASSAPVEEGEPYGIYINYAGQHVDYWEDVKPKLPYFFHDSGPKAWPRGRVAFNARVKRFEISLHEQLQTPRFEDVILEFFELRRSETVFVSDPHYVDARFMLGPDGPQASAL